MILLSIPFNKLPWLILNCAVPDGANLVKYVNKGYKLPNPYVLRNLLSIPFNKLTWLILKCAVPDGANLVMTSVEN